MRVGLLLCIIIGAVGCSDSKSPRPAGAQNLGVASATYVGLRAAYPSAFSDSRTTTTVASPTGWTTTSRDVGAVLSKHASDGFVLSSRNATIVTRMRELAGDGESAADAIVYAGTWRGQSVTYGQRPQLDGTEDFLALESAPSSEYVDYDVTLAGGVGALRLIDSVLEFEDTAGVPALRVAHPGLFEADGTFVEADLDVLGCQTDRDPAPPWGRQMVPPGANVCTVRVSWANKGITYPALFDPTWVATGNMVTPGRQHHAAAS